MSEPMAYMGRKRTCGCVIHVAVDDPERPDNTAQVTTAIASMAACDLIVERATIEEARQAYTICTHELDWPRQMWITADTIADVIEVTAALDAGLKTVDTPTVRELLDKLRAALKADTGHYLVLRTFDSSDDDFSTCGSADGVTDCFVEDGPTKIIAIDKARCPNCHGEE